MRVVINQSNYLPWKGYFDLINDADLFIFLDDVQYTKNDWRNRNRIKSANGLHWLTIPIGNATSKTIDEVLLPQTGWREKHWRSVKSAYSRAPFFSKYAPWLQETYFDLKHTTLSELNQYLIRTIATQFLGIKSEFKTSREVFAGGTKTERVISLLNAVGAKVYISGPAGKNYLQQERFTQNGIELIWKDYTGYPEYNQLSAPFEHAVSILDVIFHLGPKSPQHIWGWRSV